MADLASLIVQCAIAVHPQTAMAVVQAESHGNPYALNTQVASYYPSSREEAALRLQQAVRDGRSTDIGLMQTNSQWLRRLQIPAAALLDPCTNIRVGTAILSRNYERTWAKYRAEKPALMAALSLYNTGNETRGLRNGYVSRVVAAAGVPVRSRRDPQAGAPLRLHRAIEGDARSAATGFQRTGPKPQGSPR